MSVFLLNKNKDCLETNENTRDIQKEKIEKGKEEEIRNKIQKQSRTKESMQSGKIRNSINKKKFRIRKTQKEMEINV